MYGIDKFELFYADNKLNNLGEGSTNWGRTVTLTGTALGPNNTMFIIVRYRMEEKSLVKQIDINGKILRTWGKKGTGAGEFMTLSDIAVDSSRGFVYVTDTSNHRVQKYDLKGNFITQWGTNGSLNGKFIQPTKLALDTY
jgi:DNA-binding beta-propeller fold protein YncE